MSHLNDPHTRSLFMMYSIVAIIDPCIFPSHLPSIAIPGYTVMHSFRHSSSSFSTRAFGGILCYVADSLFPFVDVIQDNRENDLDQLIFSFGDCVFAFVYIPQPQSSVLLCMAVSPWDSLGGEIAVLYKTKKQFVILGDFNAHIGQKVPTGIPQHCSSTDSRTDAYGAELLALCASYRCYILNGDSSFEPAGKPTFLCSDNLGSSVIDYCLVSSTVYQLAAVNHFTFDVLPPFGCLDHLPLGLTLRCCFPPLLSVRRELRYTQVRVANGKSNEADTALDKLMTDLANVVNTVAIKPIPPIKDPVSGSKLRREMARLARLPGFRQNPISRGRYREHYKRLQELRKVTHLTLKPSLQDQLLDCQGRRAY